MWLVRHAKAGDRAAWVGPDHGRPLNGGGGRQAERLLEVLAPHGVHQATSTLSSDYRRCVQTVEPLARALGHAVVTEPRLREGGALRDTLELLRTCGAAVLCSHGDVIGDLVLWLDTRGLLQHRPEWPKGCTWVLTVRNGEVAGGRYVAPPPAG